MNKASITTQLIQPLRSESSMTTSQGFTVAMTRANCALTCLPINCCTYDKISVNSTYFKCNYLSLIRDQNLDMTNRFA